jgi:hypothetical protein
MAKNERVEVAPQPNTERRVAVAFDGATVRAGETETENGGGFIRK